MIYYSYICVGLTLLFVHAKKNIYLTVINAKLLEKSLVQKKSKIWSNVSKSNVRYLLQIMTVSINNKNITFMEMH